MSTPEGFNLPPENKLDISAPDRPFFRYNKSERQEMLDRGMTDDQITADEIARANRIAENRKAA